MARLAPLSEEPVDDELQAAKSSVRSRGLKEGVMTRHRNSWRSWIKTHLPLLIHNRLSSRDLKILLSVLACPLCPLPLNLPTNEVISSSAQYIIQHYAAATGCRKLEGSVKNIFATGKVSMAVVDHHHDLLLHHHHHHVATAGTAVARPTTTSTASSTSTNKAGSYKGCFVMWKMAPDKWLIELVVAGHNVVAGSDGNVAWRHTPWLGAHAAKGTIRPLRRAVQGLDPMAISAVFSTAQHMGEKPIMGVDCFVLKLSADQTDLTERSDSTAEMIKHAIFGYFCQKSGLLVYLEDSSLTRIQSPGSHPTYWETTMSTKIEDYRTVDGAMIAHSGQTNVIITQFGDDLKAGPIITRLEEIWAIDDVAFNVPGLSSDCFIPPKEVR